MCFDTFSTGNPDLRLYRDVWNKKIHVQDYIK